MIRGDPNGIFCKENLRDESTRTDLFTQQRNMANVVNDMRPMPFIEQMASLTKKRDLFQLSRSNLISKTCHAFFESASTVEK